MMQEGAQAGAGRAGALRAIEGEEAGDELPQGDAAWSQAKRSEKSSSSPRLGTRRRTRPSASFRASSRESVEAGPQVGLDRQPVHHRLDGVAAVLVQGRQSSRSQTSPLIADADVALVAQTFQGLRARPYVAADHRGQQHHAAPSRQAHDLVHDLADALARRWAGRSAGSAACPRGQSRTRR